MARGHRNLQVAFYVVEPRKTPDNSPPTTFDAGKFPDRQVLEEIGHLDIASGDYYMETTLFDRVVCFVHGEEFQILGAYSKDVLTAPMTEYKGELGHLPLRDDEGIVDPTYVAFFPGSIAGVLRCSVKAPGVTTIANYISEYTSHRCNFRPLPSNEGAVQAQLATPDPSFYKLIVKAKRSVVAQFEGSQSSVARALFAASQHSSADTVKLELTSGGGPGWRDWWDEMEASVSDLLDYVADLDVAKIELRGSRDTVNLKRDFVTIRYPVETTSGRVTPYSAARALARTYQEAEPAVLAAARQWKEISG